MYFATHFQLLYLGDGKADSVQEDENLIKDERYTLGERTPL